MGFFVPSGELRLIHKFGEEIIQLPDPPHVHQPLIQSFVNELKGGTVLESTGETALEAARVIDHILCKYRGVAAQRAILYGA